MLSPWALRAPLLSLFLGACSASPAPPPAASPPPPPVCARPDLQAVEKATEGDHRSRAGSLDEATALYTEAARLDPKNHRILFKLAMALRKQERWDAMEDVLARAVEIAPGYANYWLERGYALEMRARRKEVPWERARESLARCVALDPNLADCHLELGQVLLRLDDEPGALRSYSQAIERDPTSIASYTMLAGLYLDVGRVGEAAAVLAAAGPFLGPARPGDKAQYNVHVLAAKVHQIRGDLDGVVRELEAARVVAPPDGPEGALMLWNLGSTYAMLQPPRKEEAITLLRAFELRACRSTKAAAYRSECTQLTALIARLGGAP